MNLGYKIKVLMLGNIYYRSFHSFTNKASRFASCTFKANDVLHGHNNIMHIGISSPLNIRKIPLSCRNLSDSYDGEDGSSSEEESEDFELDDEEHEEVSQHVYKLIPGMGHKVLLLLPKIKWGPKRNDKTTPELQLVEAETLVETLENWKVVQKIIVSCISPDKKYIFGSGNLLKLKRLVANPDVSAVFINQNVLTGLQHSSLEDYFQKPVYDRYTIVLRIFLEHAKSKEAKLQVALAEIPYLRSRLGSLHNKGERESGSMKYVGGAGETYLETRRRLLAEREMKLKKWIEKLKSNRRLLRENRRRRTFPSVAVIGYTNCGKTSLIKALTQDEKLMPKAQLFATLDVTAHKGFLPCQQAVIFMDTIGFITDIPTNLIQSFAATLDDISVADLIVHIWDASHPDVVNQKETVKKTLDSLSLPPRLLGTLLHVGNKSDLLKGPVQLEEGELLISATEGTGLSELWQEVQKRLISNTGLLFLSVRVQNGGQEMSWLKKNCAVQDMLVDPNDSNFLILNITCSYAFKKSFEHHFGLKMENQTLELK